MRIVDARARPPLPAFARAFEPAPRRAALASLAARGWSPVGSIVDADPTLYRGEMDAAGIAIAGLPARAPNELWDASDNEAVLAAASSEPERFYAYAAVDPASPGASDSVAGLAAKGARGIVLEPCLCTPPRDLDDPLSDPVLEACEAVRLPVLLMAGGEAGADLGHFHPVNLERLAARFPRLQLVSVHAGWPWVQEAVGVAFRRPNVWLLPDCYFPGLPGHDDYLAAIRTYLRDRFLFATGYPYCPLGEMVDRYFQLGLPDDVLTAVMGDNAARLFAI